MNYVACRGTILEQRTMELPHTNPTTRAQTKVAALVAAACLALSVTGCSETLGGWNRFATDMQAKGLPVPRVIVNGSMGDMGGGEVRVAQGGGGGREDLNKALLEATAGAYGDDGGKIDASAVKRLIAAGANVNYSEYLETEGTTTPLGNAIYHGNLDVAKILLEHGANPNAETTIIDISGDGFDTTTTNFVLAAHKMTWGGGSAADIEMLRLLLDKGANINGVDEEDATALMVLAGYSDKDNREGENNVANAARFLLERGADANFATDWVGTALERAESGGSRQTANVLKNAGAKRIPVESATAADARGNTALMFAARSGDTKAMQRLIAAGANVNAHNAAGNTALMIASKNVNISAARLLLDKGADVNATNNQGETALMNIGCERGGDRDNPYSCKTDIAALLIKRGANINARDGKNRTALERFSSTGDYQEYYGAWDKVQKLLESSARKPAAKKKR